MRRSLCSIAVRLVITTTAAVGLAAVGGVSTARAAPTPTGWAALGDSYTSGPLIPNQTLDPLGCLRSDHNYPHLAAADLGYSLSDISCSGATVADLTRPQATDFGTNPPQLSVVNTGDRVVTLGIGGNDIGFESMIENCEALTPWGPTKVGLTCKAHYDAGGHDTIAGEIAALQPKVQAALVEIHALAPQAQIFLVGYPAILPPTGSGCWPQMPLTTTDVPYLRAKEVQLNSMLAAAAGAENATYVDTYSPSETHNACTAESTRWVEPLVPASVAYPVHPNAAGERGMAAAVEQAVMAAGG